MNDFAVFFLNTAKSFFFLIIKIKCKLQLERSYGGILMAARYRFADSVAWQEEKIRGYVYAFDQITDQYYKFDRVGKFIWSCIERQESEEEIINSVCMKYNGDTKIIQADVSSFMNDLLLKGLIEKC